MPRRPQSAVGEATSGFLEIPLAVPHRDIDVVQVEMGHCQVIAEDRRVRDDVVDGPHLRHAESEEDLRREGNVEDGPV